MRSRVCFDAVHSDRLRLLIEYGMLTGLHYFGGARDQRQMIQRVGTIEGTFTRCFDMFILGHAPILACWLWFFVTASRALIFASLPLLVRWFLGIAPEFDPLLRYSPENLLRYLPEFHHFLVLARNLLRYSPGPFSGTRPELFRYLPEAFSVLARNLLQYSPGPFSSTRPEPFRYSPEPFFGTRPDPSPVFARTLLRYSPGAFSVLARSLLLYSPEAFSVLARTLLWYLPKPFSGNCPNPSPVLARSFFGTCPNPSPVLARRLLWYSPGAFSVLARTLLRCLPEPFSSTRPELFRYLLEPFSGTCPEPSPVLAQSFFGTFPNPSPVLAWTFFQYSAEAFSVLARTLLQHSPRLFSGTCPDSTFFFGTCPNRIPNLSRHCDRVSLYLFPASYLYPIVHSEHSIKVSRFFATGSTGWHPVRPVGIRFDRLAFGLAGSTGSSSQPV
uniref:Uncharacterized protein n=1 Tax=Vitis vinifera TaxID=29760 RepID=A5B2W8_VITVI|nr:hypothetical protein VITISV_022398 [Vitis vinifera]